MYAKGNSYKKSIKQLLCLNFECYGFRCVDMVKGSQYVELANDLEINKAITYLRQRNFNQVRNILMHFCYISVNLDCVYCMDEFEYILAHIYSFSFFFPYPIICPFSISHVYNPNCFLFLLLYLLAY